jgi:hypothetical protein
MERVLLLNTGSDTYDSQQKLNLMFKGNQARTCQIPASWLILFKKIIVQYVNVCAVAGYAGSEEHFNYFPLTFNTFCSCITRWPAIRCGRVNVASGLDRLRTHTPSDHKDSGSTFWAHGTTSSMQDQPFTSYLQQHDVDKHPFSGGIRTRDPRCDLISHNHLTTTEVPRVLLKGLWQRLTLHHDYGRTLAVLWGIFDIDVSGVDFSGDWLSLYQLIFIHVIEDVAVPSHVLT